ncbi:hypothetical protein AB0J80_20970 [Actinoplanes sp. NPDC049548]|uniref:hypothetical protein n=1 Tax=Actinoplanes sp. NPDC049548 TaxID=3155152 RepID=UPI003418BA74
MPGNERFARARAAKKLTEGQLAELVADLIASLTGRRPPIDADHVGRIERGLITWPGRAYRSAFRTVLGVTADAELGFYSRRSGGTHRPASIDVDRQLPALASAATVGELTSGTIGALTSGLGAPRMPARVGRADVADLNRVIDGMERADHAAGGRTVVRTLALAQLSWAQETLRLSSFRAADVRTAWMTAVARLGRLAGFMCVDARDHRTARQTFLIALQIAAAADSWPSRLNVISGMVRQAVHLGDGRSALLLTTLARAGESSASLTTLAMLRVLEARAYGVLGRAAEAAAAVEAAESLFARRKPEDDPPWLWFYDEAQLLGDTGHALYPLALGGCDVDAIRRLRGAVDLHDVADLRGRAFSLTKLATLEVRTRCGREALATADRAIAATADLRSGRALDFLNDLGRALRSAGDEESRALAAKVSETLRTARRA